MGKKIGALLCVAGLLAALVGCGGNGATGSMPAAANEAQSAAASAPAPASTGSSAASVASGGGSIRIAGLKGPTTMGMVRLMQNAEEGKTAHDYQVAMYGTADEIVPALVAGEVDLAAIPANLASVLYSNTGGDIQVAAINTLGVLYLLQNGEGVQSIEDLRGKTVYSTGKGTTPEFVLHYILTQNGLTPGQDVTVEFKSESTEVAALLAAEEGAVAVLPQPYATAVQMQNPAVRQALDLTEEWDALGEGGALVTGVLVGRREFIEQNPALLADFLKDYESSIIWVRQNTAEAAQLVAQYGIVEKPQVAEKALPACNLTFVAGADMQEMLAGYLAVLYAQKPEAVGGALPGDDFYYGV